MVEVIIAVSTKMILENARSFHLVVCYDYNDHRSIGLTLTKINQTKKGWYYTDDLNEIAFNYLRESRDEVLSGEAKHARFYRQKTGRHLGVFRPWEAAS